MMRPRTVGVLLAAAAAVLPAAAIAADPVQAPATGSAPAATTSSSFRADRAASQPVGLLPDDAGASLEYPDQPIVLRWSPVTGAASYKVVVASNPGFTKVVWSGATDQPAIAPEVLFPDGGYWWRVTAVDAAGTTGVASAPARFARSWPSAIGGTRLADAPGGPESTIVGLTPYMSWDALPGAKEYEVQVAAADRFATPALAIVHDHAPFFSPGASVGLPADTYAWRVRARDPEGNPGPWTLGGSFQKSWAAPTPLGPTDGATVSGIVLRWAGVTGAESYEVQASGDPNNWDGATVKLSLATAGTTVVPTAAEQAGLTAGPFWWRVRAKTGGVASAWSSPLRFVYAPPAAGAGPVTPVQLTPAADLQTALPPVLEWSPIAGADVYRVDIATDTGFTNVVHSEVTRTPAWAPRSPLSDNQVGTGYFWRVIPGAAAPLRWLMDEALASVGTFKKQTQVTLAQGAGGLVDAPPLLTWDPVPGAARYDVQLSQNQQLDAGGGEDADAIATTVWGLGLVPGSQDAGTRLSDGTWYWRVRAVDAAGKGQAWSPLGSFTLTSPRPAPSLPVDGQTVVGSPELRWSAVPQACSYGVQLKNSPSLTDTDPVITTAQTALVPTGAQVSQPGRWYWRVRADHCGVTGQWSPTRSFKSARPADFGLNTIPARTAYGSRVTVSGALSFGGARVRTPTLVLERRIFGEDDYRFFGTVRADAQGRFAVRLTSRRTAAYRLRWAAEARHPEGQAAFSIQVLPRVQLNLSAARTARRSAVVASGFVFPARRAQLQVQTAQGWETLRTLKAGSARFRVGLGSGLEPGPHRVRLLVPGDQKLATARSTARPLMVYDRFVIRGAR